MPSFIIVGANTSSILIFKGYYMITSALHPHSLFPVCQTAGAWATFGLLVAACNDGDALLSLTEEYIS